MSKIYNFYLFKVLCTLLENEDFLQHLDSLSMTELATLALIASFAAIK